MATTMIMPQYTYCKTTPTHFEFFLTTTLIQLKNCDVKVWNLFLMVVIYFETNQIIIIILLGHDFQIVGRLSHNNYIFKLLPEII